MKKKFNFYYKVFYLMLGFKNIINHNSLVDINANFQFTFGACVFDFYQFYRAYNPTDQTYFRTIDYWERLSSYNNFLQLTYTETSRSDEYAKELDDFKDKYINKLLIIEILIAIFSIGQSLLMIYVYNLMTTMLTMIAGLFLKQDKPRLNKLKDHYTRTIRILNMIDKTNMQGYVTNDDKPFDEELEIETNKDDNKIVPFIELI